MNAFLNVISKSIVTLVLESEILFHFNTQNIQFNMSTFFKHIFILAIASLTLFSSCKTTKDAASQSVQASKDKMASAKLENALLWKIDGNGLQQPSYLYGTIHIIDSEDYFLPDGTLSAIDNSKKMVFEIDMAEMNDMGSVMGIMNQAFMKDGKTLSDLLEDDEYKIVEDHFKKIGMPLMMLERMKPMFLTVFASGDMDPNGLQSGAMKSYEMEFASIAETKALPTAGLETIEFQMSVFDSIPYEAQADMLLESIKSGDAGNDEFKAMIQMYKDQRITDMVSMFESEEEGIAEYEDVLLNKRNAAWISGMNTMMKELPTFFAVGAGHLAGEKGVINLLKKEGYTLTPISHKK